MSNIETYFYDEQFKRYALQFNAIFSGLQVMVGKSATSDEKLISVPIIYGSQDRVASAAAHGHTQNKHLRVPMMSSNLVNFDIANDRMKGTGATKREVFVPLGGVLPNDAKVVRTRMAVPYDLTFDLSIYTSNKDQQFQILEQILVLFDPILQIQTSEAHLDPTKISTVEIISINPEESFPPGTESRVIVTTIQFKIDAYITIPATVKTDVVQQIYARISTISDAHVGIVQSDGTANADIPALYDELGIEPTIIATAFIDN